LVLHFGFCVTVLLLLKIRIEQSVESYPTPRRTVTAGISPRSEDFSVSVMAWPAVDTAADTDRSRSR